MDLYDFMNHASMGSEKAMGSSSWGWTSADGREFGAIGQGGTRCASRFGVHEVLIAGSDGTAFVEISKKGKLTYLGRLPPQSFDSFWHVSQPNA